MRVAVITKHFPNSRQHWAGQSAYETLRVLATRCELEVFYPEAVYPRLLKPRGASSEPLDRTWMPDGVKTTYVPHRVLPVVSRSLNGLVITRRLLPYVRAYAPDVLLSYFIYPDGYAAVNIGRALGVPVVLTAVGSDVNRIADPLLRRLTASTLRAADYVATVSQDLAKKTIALGADPARTRVKLNGCNTSVFYPRDRRAAREALGLDADAATIVYVGRLDYRKGLMELVESVAQLRTQHPRVRCYMVGSGPDENLLRQAIAKRNAEDLIFIQPACPMEQVALWMAAADLVTLPSYNEGCPNVVVEALAAGRPVVGTSVGGIPELMGENSGRLVPVRDVPALTQALHEVLSATWDPQAISSARSRSWADVATETENLLKAALARS